MEIICDGCGSVWKINVEDDDDKLVSPVTAELLTCLMCIPTEEEEDEELGEEDEDELEEEVSGDSAIEKKMKELAYLDKEGKLRYPYKKRPGVLSKEADEVIKNNYKENIDRELVELIKEETGEDYIYEQVKARRKHLGLFKTRGSLTGRPNLKNKKYTDEHIEFLRDNSEEQNNADLMKNFNEKFDMDVKVSTIQNLLSTNGIIRERRERPREPEPMEIEIKTPEDARLEKLEKRKLRGMSEQAVKIIQENYMEKTDDELREMIADKTESFFQVDKIKNYRESNGMARPEGWNPDEFGTSGD